MPEFVINENLILGGPIAWDSVWRPGFVGNGRLRLSGTVQEAQTIQNIKFRINGGSLTQVEGALTELQTFSFWVGPFVQGVQYVVDIHVLDSNNITTIFSIEQFTWNIPVRDMATRFKELYLPPFMQGSELANKLWVVYACAWGDIFSMFDDAIAQMLPQYSTWSIKEWENQLELPSPDSTSLNLRRSEVENLRRSNFESRTEFIDVIESLTGGVVTLDENFGTRVVTITITGSNTAISQAHVTRMINKLKPVGITVNIVYA